MGVRWSSSSHTGPPGTRGAGDDPRSVRRTEGLAAGESPEITPNVTVSICRRAIGVPLGSRNLGSRGDPIKFDVDASTVR